MGNPVLGAGDTPRVHEHQAGLEVERQLGFARLVAVAIGASTLLVQDMAGPDWSIVLAWGGCALVALSALVVLQRVRADRLTARTADAAAWAETLGLSTLLPAATDEHTAFVVLMLLTMAVLAALRDGRRGLVRAMTVGIAMELVRSGLGMALMDHVHPEDSLTGIVLAGAVGAVVARVADLSRDRARDAQQVARHLEVQRRVVLAGIGGHEEDALQRMADELGRMLDAVSVSIVLQGDDGGPRVVATTDAAVRGRTSPVLLPDGPLDRTLHHGEVCLASPDQLRELAGVLPPRGSVSTAPIRRGGTVLGALCIDTPPGVELAEADLQMVARLADQMSLVIEAARSLEREADLAMRYRELDRLKTDFVAITSHELRTPLTTVVGAIATMQQRMDDLDRAEVRRLVDALARQAGRLTRLVDDLRTVSRVDAGTLATLPRPTDVTAVVSDALAALPELAAELRVVEPVTKATADPDRLLQVVTNLLANGDQHGEGVVVVEVSSTDAEVVLRVWDDGPGIPSDRREDVFERFVRLGDTDSHTRGTGLGLAIARELVEAMHGSINVVDRGPHTAFEVRLSTADTAA